MPFVFIWGAVVVNNPYLMVLLFGHYLLILVCSLTCFRKFIGFVLFLVYVGGIIILISYCAMLMPSSKFKKMSLAPLAAYLIYSNTFVGSSSYSYGMLFSRRAVVLLALLLYLVILSVVDIVNYSRGMMKLYVQFVIVFCLMFCFVPSHYSASLI